MRSTDPERMSREDILAELGQLLAVGVQRHISSSIGPAAKDSDPQKPLDVPFASEAPCGGPKETSK